MVKRDFFQFFFAISIEVYFHCSIAKICDELWLCSLLQGIHWWFRFPFNLLTYTLILAKIDFVLAYILHSQLLCLLFLVYIIICTHLGTVIVFISAANPIVGWGSIHVDTAINSFYLDYSKVPSSWKLDNGDPYPARKNFINANLDLVASKFTGEISWVPTAISGVTRWSYDISSGDSFNTLSGSITGYDAQGNVNTTWVVGTDIHFIQWSNNSKIIFVILFINKLLVCPLFLHLAKNFSF